MTGRVRASILALIVTVAPASMQAQLALPNQSGVRAGLIGINATDVEAHAHFWRSVGGRVIDRGPTRSVIIPGAEIWLRPKAPAGGTAGSVLNHLGLYVKDLQASVAAWKAAGLTWEPREKPVNGQGFLVAPDGVRIEIYINTAIAGPVAMHHLHLMVRDSVAAQKWYAQLFGGVEGKRLTFETVDVPGAEIVLGRSDAPQLPTTGRSVEHIGFEVDALATFAARARALGATIETAPSPWPSVQLRYIVDPWGTRIAITEGLRQLVD